MALNITETKEYTNETDFIVTCCHADVGCGIGSRGVGSDTGEG